MTLEIGVIGSGAMGIDHPNTLHGNVSDAQTDERATEPVASGGFVRRCAVNGQR